MPGRDPAERAAFRAHKLARRSRRGNGYNGEIRHAAGSCAELAVDAGEFSYAMDVIDDIAKTFAINADEMKASALAAGVDKSRLPPRDATESYLKVASDALDVWNLDLAHKAAYLAMKVGTGNKDLLDKAKEIDTVVPHTLCGVTSC